MRTWFPSAGTGTAIRWRGPQAGTLRGGFRPVQIWVMVDPAPASWLQPLPRRCDLADRRRGLAELLAVAFQQVLDHPSRRGAPCVLAGHVLPQGWPASSSPPCPQARAASLLLAFIASTYAVSCAALYIVIRSAMPLLTGSSPCPRRDGPSSRCHRPAFAPGASCPLPADAAVAVATSVHQSSMGLARPTRSSQLHRTRYLTMQSTSSRHTTP